jgi:hypothetical protein
MGSPVAPLLLIAALASPAVALPDPCVVGTPVGCDDGNPCTADLCQLGGCVHTPLVGAPCDDGNACTVGDHCDAGQCVGVPITCPDDGVTCTDDVCIAGGCVHVPVDSRCVRAGECSDARCAPERPDHDGAGCVGGAARSEGQECSEDGDACTVDQCQGDECAHQAVVDPRSCVAVRDVYRQALALASLVRGIAALLGPDAPRDLAGRLAVIDARVTAAARALAGKEGSGVDAQAGPFETPLRLRARIALTRLRRVRPRLARLLGEFSRAEVRAEVTPDAADEAMHRGRQALRSLHALRAELQRLRRVTVTFAR